MGKFDNKDVDTMEIQVQISKSQYGDWRYVSVHVRDDVLIADIIKDIVGEAEGRYKLTSKGLYSIGEDCISQKTVGENVKFVKGSVIQLKLMNVVEPTSLEKGAELLQKMRKTLAARGGLSFRALRRSFLLADEEVDDHQVTPEELLVGLKKFGMKDLTKLDVLHLMAAIDTDNSGTIDLCEFLRAVKGALNAPRLVIVRKAFEKFDANNSGTITMEDLETVYRTKADSNLEDFFNTFQVIQQTKDHEITKTEFEEYYARVSANIENDDHFVELITTAW
eukprot:CAMPEP_0117428522 /NCGR_PEP_ID=MMETSP0758-20121206/8207_1 /TAXON_ID=63605 /ORGANISM="Percolomonas cosmopolitus, Strain AE-1 (ATCC 50343)" /LENGTH=278 /DNA_ID=CAMNT_0005214917 /DNA_START=29 /DNA_END=862 /DNA_ORIENTATION=-